jgi:hypothetical protein
MSFRSPVLFLAAAAFCLAALPANAETIGTGCVAKAGGEIYRFAPYRSSPSGKCRTGDERVRLRMDQPFTAIAKRSGSSEDAGDDVLDGELVRFREDLVISITHDEDFCRLIVEDLSADVLYIVVSVPTVPSGTWRHGMSEVIIIDVTDGTEIGTFLTSGLVLLERGGRAALVFHDLFVEERNGDCHAAILVEWVEDRFDPLYRK